MLFSVTMGKKVPVEEKSNIINHSFISQEWLNLASTVGEL
jgi:hypothetical protein